ncbi:hypothetical protein DERP_006879 [Dermatophagoides pteronyssinus]|uniref:Uncharacterized protein n=1 Tax=Dermatophagoides pteronyssinus TaxID=6956 RepID=A0ABQ8ISA2_DERPT|nr:hypothetical protein DERP_006879 [Dermatophagoides pteronyssinus]
MNKVKTTRTDIMNKKLTIVYFKIESSSIFISIYNMIIRTMFNNNNSTYLYLVISKIRLQVLTN